jgi:cupin fold WbuC family metalloprotein
MMIDIRSFTKETSPGVFHCHSWGLALDSDIIGALTIEAKANNNNRARICMHPTVDDFEQQMLIVMVDNAFDTPHKHLHKKEALIPIVGAAEYQTFDHEGALVDRLLLGEDGARYVSSPLGVHHRVVLKTSVFAFWEFALGPFTSESTIPAPWANYLEP